MVGSPKRTLAELMAAVATYWTPIGASALRRSPHREYGLPKASDRAVYPDVVDDDEQCLPLGRFLMNRRHLRHRILDGIQRKSAIEMAVKSKIARMRKAPAEKANVFPILPTLSA
jgi:hypothetical protein